MGPFFAKDYWQIDLINDPIVQLRKRIRETKTNTNTKIGVSEIIGFRMLKFEDCGFKIKVFGSVANSNLSC